MSKYAWIIDKDHLDAPEDSSVGICGPRGAKQILLDMLEDGKGEQFELFDDDDILYYTGRIIGIYDGFEPLDDFGMPNAGCTAIKLNGAFV